VDAPIVNSAFGIVVDGMLKAEKQLKNKFLCDLKNEKNN